jgi:hypothetical protein
MKFDSRQEFANRLHTAAREMLASEGLAYSDEYRLQVEECPVHGPHCARVVYGMLRDHISWRWADPAKTAATMIRSMMATKQPDQ